MSYKVTLIGAGNVATHLGLALKCAGHHLVQVVSRTEQSANELAAKLGCPAAEIGSVIQSSALTSKASSLLPADIYIISVKDDVLEAVAQQLNPLCPDALWLHTAGTMPLDLLSGKGASRIGVFYPMQTFSKQKEVDFSQIPLFLESPTDLPLLTALAESISTKVYALDSEARRHLHLAAVFCCNFVNHCYALGAKVLQQIDIPFDVMLPLIDETARKVHTLSPRDAQTGPAVRGDEVVMARQQALLTDEVMRQIYKLMSESIRNHY